MRDLWMNILIGLVLILAGLICIFLPNRIFDLLLDVSILFLFLNTFRFIYRYSKSKKRVDLFFALIAFGFMLFLYRHTFFPEWFIRVMFGFYCLALGLAMGMQVFIRIRDRIKGKLFFFALMLTYFYLGMFLLWNPNFDTNLLMEFFGFYFVVLGIESLHDSFESIQPQTKYRWKRQFRLMMPPLLALFLPDRMIAKVNKVLQQGKEMELLDIKSHGEPLLKVMVHVGPEGFQKIGHICLAYKDLVYSFGNYDSESFHLFQTFGDGVYFNVRLADYIPNAMQFERNSIFEYGIYLTFSQQEMIEKELKNLEDNSYRWYCQLEKSGDYDHFLQYQKDYPSRLHYRTGAKFYKIKRGRFKTYWVTGDNCAMFIDAILGKLGCDVLSMRGIITPGSYYTFLETEYQKKGSPIVSRTIHPYTKVEVS